MIHTAELNGQEPFHYLVALQRYAEQVEEQPSEWMPWNYQATRARLRAGATANDAPAPA